MVDEFSIAVSKGVRVLPLGFTGFVAKDLWSQVGAAFDTFYPKASPRFKVLFEQFGDDSISLDAQTDAVIEALQLLQAV
jgi:hypothetical protein